MFNLRKERINYSETLGKGSFGEVYPYQKDKDDNSWVVKIIRAPDDEHLIRVFEEIVLGFSCDHPGIVPFKGYHIEKKDTVGYKVYVKLPRMAETLRQKIQRDSQVQEDYSEDQIIKYFYSLVCGLEYLHKQKRIAHRDIKPANIMISQDGDIKLCDVGLAKFLPEGESAYLEPQRAGTRIYSAPEVENSKYILKKKDLFKADAWSLGLVMIELCLKQLMIYNPKEPVFEKREAQLIGKMKELIGRYSEKLIILLFGLIDFNPDKRKSIEDAKKFIEENYPQFQNISQKQEETPSKDVLERAKIPEKQSDIHTQILKIQNDIESKFTNLQFDDSGKCRIVGLKLNQIQSVVESLKEVNLKELEIKKTEGSDAGVISLAHEMGQNLKSLRSLSIDYVSNNSISDEGLYFLAEQIGNNLESLQFLSLGLHENPTISDNGLINLTENIGKLKDLQHLSLNLCHANISDMGIEFLAHQIGNNLKSLQHLDLDVSGITDYITDAGLKSLVDQVGNNLKTLHHLSLDFSMIMDITDAGLGYLARQVSKNFKFLKSFSMRTGRIDFDSVESIVEWHSKRFK